MIPISSSLSSFICNSESEAILVFFWEKVFLLIGNFQGIVGRHILRWKTNPQSYPIPMAWGLSWNMPRAIVLLASTAKRKLRPGSWQSQIVPYNSNSFWRFVFFAIQTCGARSHLSSSQPEINDRFVIIERLQGCTVMRIWIDQGGDTSTLLTLIDPKLSGLIEVCDGPSWGICLWILC